MFEVTPDDIGLLNDKDLRTLVGLLCEAEARGRGLSASFVTWGGDQDAGDGGVDVDVALPAGTAIDGFIPRPATGFQVKDMKMPPGKIIEEMRPSGTVRPAIQELADQGGAYIIVSSESASRAMLQARLRAMTEAVKDVPNGDGLKLDFYDRTRVASWVRDHAGLIPWIREKIGKAIPGWHPYGAWAYPAEGLKGEYLLDEQLRIHTGRKEHGEGLPAQTGIEHIRALLNQPGKIARLIGLSGVGKTRFLQALFDSRVGENALAPSLAIYTNMADGPDPQPMALATDLIAAGKRAILVIDNCTPELHRRLSDACRSEGSKLSLVTVEYDVREDQPEATDVFRLEPSSPDIIAKLIKQRFPALSIINARTIADHAGGNARIALAVAGTVGNNETISGLSDDELFRRLFQQGRGEDGSLLLAAQALSLVYSFKAENISDDKDAELARLGALIGKDAQEMFRNAAELQQRDLIQHRGVWRAVLPHALANHLAKRALRNIPFSVIKEQLINGAPARLLKSFSRRLGYLSDSEEAIAIVKGWLAPNDLLRDVVNLNDLGQPMFENVAPVAPEAALSAIERVLLAPDAADAFAGCARFVRLLRQLAHDAALFDRSISLIQKFAAAETGAKAKEAREIFASFFFLYLSGTHAPLDQRLSVVRPLLASEDPNERRLAVNAVKATLEAFHFGSSYNFEFGARSRDPGYWPATVAEVRAWFRSAISFAEAIAVSDGACAAEVRDAIASQFRGLWTMAGMLDELEGLCHAIAKRHFWREGWISVRETQHFDSEGFTPEVSARLAALEQLLRPVNLAQNVRALVLTAHWHDLNDYNETRATVHGLGEAVAVDEQAFSELLEELLTEKGNSECLWHFGRGLAEGAVNPGARWERLRAQLAATPNRGNYQVLRGFLEGLQVRDPELTNSLLDNAVQDEVLERWYPLLETATKIDERGVQRLMRAMSHGKAHVAAYHSLAYGRAADPIPSKDVGALILKIAGMPDGFDSAVEVLYMRLHSEKDWKDGYAPETTEAGQQLMRQVQFAGRNGREDYRFAIIVAACFSGDAGAAPALDLCRRLKTAFLTHDTHPFYFDDLLGSLFTVQPRACLDGFCEGDAAELARGMRFINEIRQLKKSLLDMVQEAVLLAWCDDAPSTRYPAVAGCIAISTGTGEGHPRTWTKLALRLLKKRLTVSRCFGSS